MLVTVIPAGFMGENMAAGIITGEETVPVSLAVVPNAIVAEAVELEAVVGLE